MGGFIPGFSQGGVTNTRFAENQAAIESGSGVYIMDTTINPSVILTEEGMIAVYIRGNIDPGPPPAGGSYDIAIDLFNPGNPPVNATQTIRPGTALPVDDISDLNFVAIISVNASGVLIVSAAGFIQDTGTLGLNFLGNTADDPVPITVDPTLQIGLRVALRQNNAFVDPVSFVSWTPGGCFALAAGNGPVT